MYVMSRKMAPRQREREPSRVHDRDREKKDTTKKGTSIMCSNTTKPCTYKTITQQTQVSIERIRACKPWTERETHTHKVEDEGEEGGTHDVCRAQYRRRAEESHQQQQIPITINDTTPSHVVLITYNDRQREKERRER